MMPRGIRNFNPGNLRKNDIPWLGLSAEQQDPDFFQFMSPTFGIRAIVKILLHYKADGIETIADAISRWAPPSENDTDSYIAAVEAQCTNFDPRDPILIKAIILHENGIQPYDDATIQTAIELA
jgi:hypothetical protein